MRRAMTVARMKSLDAPVVRRPITRSSAARPLSVPDEGRYADISRWMLVSGDWLVPRLNGLPFFHKPPLTYWLQAASMALLGVSAPDKM